MNKDSQKIKYPYLPEGREFLYVPLENMWMEMAREFAQENSLDKVMPGSAVIVKEGEFLGIGANGSEYHEINECERIKQGAKSGEGYELCEGCHPKNHSEPSAILDVKETGNGDKIAGADLYLWGHWWCCESCWGEMIKAGIKNVYLLEGSEVLFNKEAEGNVVGRQFE